MIFPFGCYSFVITQWHKDNPNDWVAIKDATYVENGVVKHRIPPIVIGRAATLTELSEHIGKRDDVTFGRAWGMGIPKDYPLTKTKI